MEANGHQAPVGDSTRIYSENDMHRLSESRRKVGSAHRHANEVQRNICQLSKLLLPPFHVQKALRLRSRVVELVDSTSWRHEHRRAIFDGELSQASVRPFEPLTHAQLSGACKIHQAFRVVLCPCCCSRKAVYVLHQR